MAAVDGRAEGTRQTFARSFCRVQTFLNAASATAGLLAAVVIDDQWSEQRGRRSAALQRPGHTYRFFSATLAILRLLAAPASARKRAAGARKVRPIWRFAMR